MLIAYPETVDVTSTIVIVGLAIVLLTCLALTLVAPQAVTSCVAARHAGLWLGLASGAGMLLWSRLDGLEAGAMTIIVPFQFFGFVIVPAFVGAVTRSLGAAVQAILWGFVFSSVTMFPVYILESIRRYNVDGGLYLDGAPRSERPSAATSATPSPGSSSSSPAS